MSIRRRRVRLRCSTEAPHPMRHQAEKQGGQFKRAQRAAEPRRRGETRRSGGDEGKRDADGKGDHGGLFSKLMLMITSDGMTRAHRGASETPAPAYAR